MRILLLGPRGYIGGHLQRQFPDAIPSTVDIADPSAVSSELRLHNPDVVINAVGKTGTPNVDWCEDHREETFRSNVLGPLVLAEQCRSCGITMVHIGSGCIYSGDNGGKGYSEEDAANFQGSYYSRTKQWVEAMLREFQDPVDGRGGILMLRIRMPFEAGDHPKNLLSKLPRFTRVIDTPNSVTYIPDFLAATQTLIEKRRTGVWNIVNPGPVSLFQMMQIYRDIVDPGHHCTAMSESEAAGMTRAPRSNCVLSVAKLASEGLIFPTAERRMREVLSKRAPVQALHR